jgi:predicted HTH domain antitoxin
MFQINFRVTPEEYEIIKQYSELAESSIPTVVKQLTLAEIKKQSRSLALNLYRQNKIGFKQAYKLSFVTFQEFIQILIENNIEPNIPDDLDDEMIRIAKSLKFSDIFPNKTKEEIRSLLKK